MLVISNMESTNYTYVMQLFVATDGHMYVRASTNNGSSWTEWAKAYTTNYKPYTASTADLTAGTSALATGEVYYCYE